MKVFLSWSGPRSREAALLFRDWLPQVIQAVDPWMSDVDIEKGAQWFAEISREVSASSFGIVFLTRENLEKPWLHFEAGALAKSLAMDGSSPRVAAYLLGIEPTDVLGPLKEFQHTKATAEDTLKLLVSINVALVAKGERALKDEMLKSIFATYWPSLGDPLKEVIARDEKNKPRRDVRDMVEEILEYVRPRAPTRAEDFDTPKIQRFDASADVPREVARLNSNRQLLELKRVKVEAALNQLRRDIEEASRRGETSANHKNRMKVLEYQRANFERDLTEIDKSLKSIEALIVATETRALLA